MVWSIDPKTCDTPHKDTAVVGRRTVRNSRRGIHLGQRSCASAPTGRTYERKRSDQTLFEILQKGGRPHMSLLTSIRTVSAKSHDFYKTALLAWIRFL